MTPEKIAEAMEVMAEAQREEPPEGEPRVHCDVPWPASGRTTRSSCSSARQPRARRARRQRLLRPHGSRRVPRRVEGGGMPCVEMPISPKEAAEMCGVGLGSIYAAIAEGRSRRATSGGQSSRWWILRSDLEAWASGGMFEEEQP